ncbi:MAG TPA: Fic family protein [Polyangiaceae bacterium]|nr:Fic family protein [Polyangiaceae bacterium]
MSVRSKKATPKKGRAKAKATPSRRKEARKPAKKKPAAKPKRPAKKKASRTAAKRPAPKKASGKAAKKDAARLKVAVRKEKEREKKERDREKQRKDAERLKAQKAKEAEREKKEREKTRAREAKAKEVERARKEAEQKAAKVAAQKAKDAERERIRREKEEERLQKIAERDAARDEAKRIKDEERAAKDAEREAYRKAKEAERERIRAEREAARRALEGKVSRASKRAQRGDGIGRGVTTRQYRADTIPNQSGTRRHDEPLRLIGVRLPEIAQDPPRPAPLAAQTPAPPPPPPAPPALSVEERWAVINERLNGLDEQFQREYRESFEMSWVYHDSALEGVVYTFQELKTAIDPNMSVVADSGLQPVCDEIRRHRQAIEYVRELSEKKRVPINVDTIKKIYCILHPEEGDVKTVKYRKDIPQHRLYFHEYAAPDKIAYKARQVIDWLNGPEPKKLKSPIRIAARVHYDLLRVFPFPQDSGKVSRLLMNVLLMRAGHPPAIIHSTERQRYYEALKGQLPIIVSMVSESIMNALLSIEKKIEDYDATKARASSPPKGDEKAATPSAVVAATTARDTDLDSDLYLDQEMEDSDSDAESESDDDSGDD